MDKEQAIRVKQAQIDKQLAILDVVMNAAQGISEDGLSVIVNRKVN